MIAEKRKSTTQTTVAKRRKTKTETVKKFVSSFEVFCKHVSFEDDKVDVSQIFSLACFNKWLSTRPGRKIQHPEQSFQRVLYAHIRGADNRKPFPKEIETALLTALRCGKDKSPWKQVFPRGRVDVGRRGFKSKGFHEKKQLQELLQVKQPANIPNSQIPLRHSNSSSNITPHTLSNHLPSQYYAAALATEKALGAFPQSTEGKNKAETPWSRMMKFLESVVPKEQREKKPDSTAFEGLGLFSPAVYFFMNTGPSPQDYRFQDEFMFPKREEQLFDQSKPVATLRISEHMTVNAEDQNAIAILGGSSIGMPMFKIVASLVAMLYATAKTLSTIVDSGVTWRREIFKKRDNTNIVVLHRIIYTGTEYLVTFQDHSEKYPELLKTPIFL